MKTLALLTALTLSGCYGLDTSGVSRSADLLEQVFNRHSQNVESVVLAGNLTPEAEARFRELLRKDRDVWQKVYTTHEEAIAALDAGASAEQIDEIIDRGLDLAEDIKRLESGATSRKEADQ